jgi:hypothetical protein
MQATGWNCASLSDFQRSAAVVGIQPSIGVTNAFHAAEDRGGSVSFDEFCTECAKLALDQGLRDEGQASIEDPDIDAPPPESGCDPDTAVHKSAGAPIIGADQAHRSHTEPESLNDLDDLFDEFLKSESDDHTRTDLQSSGALALGTAVEIFSSSHKIWAQGVVEAVHQKHDGTHEAKVAYTVDGDRREKWVSAEDTATVRLAADTDVVPTGPSLFCIGTAVEIYSTSYQTWVAGVVVTVDTTHESEAKISYIVEGEHREKWIDTRDRTVVRLVRVPERVIPDSATITNEIEDLISEMINGQPAVTSSGTPPVASVPLPRVLPAFGDRSQTLRRFSPPLQPVEEDGPVCGFQPNVHGDDAAQLSARVLGADGSSEMNHQTRRHKTQPQDRPQEMEAVREAAAAQLGDERERVGVEMDAQGVLHAQQQQEEAAAAATKAATKATAAAEAELQSVRAAADAVTAVVTQAADADMAAAAAEAAVQLLATEEMMAQMRESMPGAPAPAPASASAPALALATVSASSPATAPAPAQLPAKEWEGLDAQLQRQRGEEDENRQRVESELLSEKLSAESKLSEAQSAASQEMEAVREAAAAQLGDERERMRVEMDAQGVLHAQQQREQQEEAAVVLELVMSAESKLSEAQSAASQEMEAVREAAAAQLGDERERVRVEMDAQGILHAQQQREQEEEAASVVSALVMSAAEAELQSGAVGEVIWGLETNEQDGALVEPLPFAAGDNVQVECYPGDWYAAVVRRAFNVGSKVMHDVEYSDGEMGNSVDLLLLRKLPPSFSERNEAQKFPQVSRNQAETNVIPDGSDISGESSEEMWQFWQNEMGEQSLAQLMSKAGASEGETQEKVQPGPLAGVTEPSQIGAPSQLGQLSVRRHLTQFGLGVHADTVISVFEAQDIPSGEWLDTLECFDETELSVYISAIAAEHTRAEIASQPPVQDEQPDAARLIQVEQKDQKHSSSDDGSFISGKHGDDSPPKLLEDNRIQTQDPRIRTRSHDDVHTSQFGTPKSPSQQKMHAEIDGAEVITALGDKKIADPNATAGPQVGGPDAKKTASPKAAIDGAEVITALEDKKIADPKATAGPQMGGADAKTVSLVA